MNKITKYKGLDEFVSDLLSDNGLQKISDDDLKKILKQYYKIEQKKYNFLTITQLKNIDRFVEDIFKNRNNNGDIDFVAPLDDYHSIEGYQKISLFYTRKYVTNEQTGGLKYEFISILDGGKLIKEFDISNLTKEDVRKLLKEELNKIKIQFIQHIFKSAKSIWQNPNIKQNSLNFSLLKFYKDNYKKEIKDRKKYKQNEFYSNYAEIIKSQKKPTHPYKWRGYLDYKQILSQKLKDLKLIDKICKQLLCK